MLKTMKKSDIQSILIAAKYLALCKVNSKCCKIARSYLTHRIKILLDKKIISEAQMVNHR